MGSRGKLQWQFFPTHLAVGLVCLSGAIWSLMTTFAERDARQALDELKSEAALAEGLLSPLLLTAKDGQVDARLKELGRRVSSRITVILADGRVLGDSQEDPSSLVEPLNRPEIREALAGRVGISQRYSFRASAQMLFVAAPVKLEDAAIVVVRVGKPLMSPSAMLWKDKGTLGAVIIGGLVIALALSFHLAYRISRPIAELAAVTERMPGGDPLLSAEGRSWNELDALASAISNITTRLNDRIDTVTRQRNELEAVLSGMVEAVLLLDNEDKVVRTNRACRVLFRLNEEKVKSRTVHEAIRNTDLHRFVANTRASDEPVEGDLVILGDPDRFLQAHGAVLRDAHDGKTGVLIVLNDVTRLKTLENIRRDFVANVSHELKTPITSVKGFLETLKEGALRDPEAAVRFVDIAIKHTDRLDMIIDDLLTLSRIERHTERGDIKLEEAPIKEVLNNSAKACADMAREKDIELLWEAQDELIAAINSTLLEQALANLLDNAIKFSEPGKTVRVSGTRETDDIVIRVSDEGCGIPKEHLGRIFERFYRVDKGRSRKIGGTGLGLAIVKHIVNAHGGTVSVDSSPGRGTTFSMRIPASAS